MPEAGPRRRRRRRRSPVAEPPAAQPAAAEDVVPGTDSWAMLAGLSTLFVTPKLFESRELSIAYTTMVFLWAVARAWLTTSPRGRRRAIAGAVVAVSAFAIAPVLAVLYGLASLLLGGKGHGYH